MLSCVVFSFSCDCLVLSCLVLSLSCVVLCGVVVSYVELCCVVFVVSCLVLFCVLSCVVFCLALPFLSLAWLGLTCLVLAAWSGPAMSFLVLVLVSLCSCLVVCCPALDEF